MPDPDAPRIRALRTVLSDGRDRTLGQLAAVTGWSIRDLARMLHRIDHRVRKDPMTGTDRYAVTTSSPDCPAQRGS